MELTPRQVFDRMNSVQLLDVRELEELTEGTIPGVQHIALGSVPDRHDELDRSRPNSSPTPASRPTPWPAACSSGRRPGCRSPLRTTTERTPFISVITQATSLTPSPIGAGEFHGWVLNHDDLMIIDVRDAAEFESRHVRGSYHVPLHLLREHSAEFAARMGTRVVLVCQSGRRAEEARKTLDAVGLTSARVLTGGVTSYAAVGGEIVTGRRTWAMDRQVRMTAGSLVLASVLAGRFIAPQFRLIAGVIGAGLTVSAATNRCTLGRILSWMPWNRAVSEPTAREALAHLAPPA